MATGRIGVTPTLGTRWSKAPAGGTTSLSGLDDNSVALVYSVGYEQVYRNGVLLSRGNDYTATSGNSITLIDATIAGDIIEVFANELVPLTDAISKGQFTAKGALLSATAASTPAVLTVGSNDQVLTADSSTATGLKWATALKPFINTGIAGNYLHSPASTASTSRTITAGITTYVPVYLDGTNFDRIGVSGGTSFSGTATVRLGIYNYSASTQKPTTVYLDAGTLSVNAGSLFEITINSTPPEGYYFLAFNCQTAAATTNTFQCLSGMNSITEYFASHNGSNNVYFSETVSVTGGFATAGTLTTTANDAVNVALRRA